MNVRRRQTRTVSDEEHLRLLLDAEMRRIIRTGWVPELLMILPTCTLMASAQEDREFCRTARRELNRWNRWLVSCLGNRNKREFFRNDHKDEYIPLMTAGLFLFQGEGQKFSKYERQFKERITQGDSSGG